MDALELGFLASALAVSIAVGVQHFYDRFHPDGFYQRSTRRATEGVDRLTTAVEGLKTAFVVPEFKMPELPTVDLTPLTTRLDALPSAIGPEIGKALGEFALKAEASLEAPTNLPQIAGAVETNIIKREKSEVARFKELNSAIGESVLGKYGKLLETFAKPVYDFLTENPDMTISALQSKPIQDIIKWASQQAAEHPEIMDKARAIADLAPLAAKAWWELA